MKRINGLLTLWVFLVYHSTGLAQATSEIHETLDPAIVAIAKGNNEFAIDLYRQLAKDAKPDGNICFSPYSISSALAMTYAGARGETAEEMAKVLRFDRDQEKLHPAFAAFSKHLTKPTKSEFLVANSLWVERTLGLNKPIMNVLESHYGAGLRVVDFVEKSEDARLQINRWISEKTQKNIPDVLPPGSINARTRLALANAIYFRDSWKYKFDSKLTKEEKYYVTPMNPLMVSMMRQQISLRYIARDDYKMVELPYAGGSISMLVVLPNSHEKMKAVENSLEKIIAQTGWMQEEEVILALPRFALEGSANLNHILSRMGMVQAFDPNQADFSAAAPMLFISGIFHKAKVEVDEVGSTAAAATVVVVGVIGAPIKPTVICDHPFLILLRETTTGSVLFIGRVSRP